MLPGVASSHLAALQPGDPIYVSVRSSNNKFHLPEDSQNMPIILVAAGTGVAPFRGFIQERAAIMLQKGGGGARPLARALLYYGCREPGRDDLYSDEFAKWEELGAVTVRRAYSRAPQAAGGHRYVQESLWAERDELRSLWKAGARVYVCGSRALGQAVDRVACEIKKEREKQKGNNMDEAEVRDWWASLRNVRYVVDVFD